MQEFFKLKSNLFSLKAAPEVMIEVENLEFYEEQNLTIQCNVKSLVPANIEWTFNGGILESLHPMLVVVTLLSMIILNLFSFNSIPVKGMNAS